MSSGPATLNGMRKKQAVMRSHQIDSLVCVCCKRLT